MAKICPICKQHKLILGGQVAKDGFFCGKCWDKLYAKGIRNLKNLTMHEIATLIDEIDSNKSVDSNDLKTKINENKEAQKNYETDSKIIIEKFKKHFSDFFSNKGIKENSSLQITATQFLWHMLKLKKMRLDSKNIKLDSKIEQLNLNYGNNFLGESFFDGKYEIGIAQQTVNGEVKYLREENVLHTENDFNVFRFRTINAKHIGEKKVICPSCGSKASRSNLVDGCDYCGSKFTVEDLGLRVSEFSIEKDFGIETDMYTEGKKKIKGASGFGRRIALVVLIAYFFFMITGQIPFTFENLIVSFLASGFVWLVTSFLYKVVKKVFGFTSAFGKSTSQSSKRYLSEEKRYNKNIIEKIKKSDTLFSADGFYSEIQNILSAVHFASTKNQVSAFFEGEIKNNLQPIIDSYKNIIDIFLKSIYISDYSFDEKYQTIKTHLDLNLLEENDGKISKRNESLDLVLLKDVKCKTQAVCPPAFLRCNCCGASLSLMDGAKCNYCGMESRLSEFGWAIADYKID